MRSLKDQSFIEKCHLCDSWIHGSTSHPKDEQALRMGTAHNLLGTRHGPEPYDILDLTNH